VRGLGKTSVWPLSLMITDAYFKTFTIICNYKRSGGVRTWNVALVIFVTMVVLLTKVTMVTYVTKVTMVTYVSIAAAETSIYLVMRVFRNVCKSLHKISFPVARF
jgi:hypothetical protein